MNEKIAPAPKGAGAAGRRLWKSVLVKFDLETHEAELLGRACRVLDVCEDLQAIVDHEGVMATGASGQPVAHPALVELRAQELTLARLLVALRVPIGEADDDHGGPRLQRRGTRGFYSVGGRS